MKDETLVEQKSEAELLLELAKLYSARCDFDVAIPKAEGAAQKFLEAHDYENFLKATNLQLRMHAEREEFDKITRLKEKLQDLIIKEGLQLSSRAYYTLGVCSHLKKQYDVAIEYFQKALGIALANDNKEDMAYSIMGLAITYSVLGRLTEALQEIYNLNVFLEVLDLPDLKLSLQIFNGTLLADLERYDQAIDVLQGCYSSLRVEKNLYLYLNFLFALGNTYRLSGDRQLAEMHLQLAKQTADANNLKAFVKHVNAALTQLGVELDGDSHDMVLDFGNKSVIEKKRGRVDFKNQFILLDLLQLFVRSPGQVFTKEEIAAKIWGQEYDPTVHDNKIYVTIKRLRKLIEPDLEKPRYIFRAKNGYYLNKNAKIRFESTGRQ